MRIDFKRAQELLILLILADIGFIVVHLLRVNTPYLNDPGFSLEMDRGYSEIYQYVKEFWVAAIFLWLALLRRQAGYLVAALLAGYLLLDDSFHVHETLGGTIATAMNFRPALGLRAKDFGELAVSGLVGLTFLIALTALYFRHDAAFRSICHRIGFFVLLLAFFGVGVDMLHMMTHDIPVLGTANAVLEDGGEMVVMSLMCFYIYTVLLRQRESGTATNGEGQREAAVAFAKPQAA